MMDTKLMPGFLGHCTQVLTDVPLALSPSGRVYFAQGLMAMNNDITLKAHIKMQKFDEREDRIHQEIIRETLNLADEHDDVTLHHCDYDLGPVSFSQTMMHHDVIDQALDYVRSNKRKSIHDTKLYHHLLEVPKEWCAQKKRFAIQNKNNPDSIDRMDDNTYEQAVDILFNHALSDVFTLFRTAQYDMLNPLEKQAFLLDGRNYFPCIDDVEYGFKGDAVYQMHQKLPENPDVIEILPINMRQFIMLYDNFNAVMHQKGVHQSIDQKITAAQGNAYHFQVMQRMIASFENMQMMYFWEMHDYLRSDPLRYQVNDYMAYLQSGYAQKYINQQEYINYYEERHQSARICLPERAEYCTSPFVANVTDFSSTIYANPDQEDSLAYMNDNGRKGFDALLQKDIQYRARKHDAIVPDVHALRQAITKIEPRF